MQEEAGCVKVLDSRANSSATSTLLSIQFRISREIVRNVERVMSGVIMTICSSRVSDGPLSISKRVYFLSIWSRFGTSDPQ